MGTVADVADVEKGWERDFKLGKGKTANPTRNCPVEGFKDWGWAAGERLFVLGRRRKGYKELEIGNWYKGGEGEKIYVLDLNFAIRER